MKKILILLLSVTALSTNAQQVISTTVKFNNNVTFNDSTFGNPSKVPVTTFEDTLRYTRGAGAGKILASDANGNAYWTNSSSIDTFSGTPVFPSGIKTDTVFTTGGTTGQMFTLINDTIGVFANAPFWKLTGNAGTIPGTNFIGTTDAQNLIGKTNAVERFNFSATGQANIQTSFAPGDSLYFRITDNIWGAGVKAAQVAHITNDGLNGIIVYDGALFSQSRNTTLFGFYDFDQKNAFIRSEFDSATNRSSIFLQLGNGIIRYSEGNYTDSGKVIRMPLRYIDGQQGTGKVLTSDASGNATWQGSDGDFVIDSVATTGDTTDLAANTYTAIIASGAITDLVLRFPASPSNGDVVVAKFDFAVTTLTSDGQGKTIYGFPSSTALGQHREWRYNATTGAWY